MTLVADDPTRLWDDGSGHRWDDNAERDWVGSSRLWSPGGVRTWADGAVRTWSVYVAPTSIPYDGSADVTAALQAWFDEVPDGSIARLQPGGVYTTEGPILLRDRVNLTIDGDGATIRALTDGSGTAPPDSYFNHLWPRKRTRFTVLGGSGVTIRNIILRGGNPYAGTDDLAYVEALEAQHGVEFVEHSGGSLTGSQVYDVWGDFAYMTDVDRIFISGNIFHRNGRQGVAIASGTNIWITGNNMDQMRRATFDLEPNFVGAAIDNLHIEDNVTGGGRLLWLANGGASWQVSNIHIRNNVMVDRTGVPVIQSFNGSPDGLKGPWFVEGNSFIVGGSPSPGFVWSRSSAVYFKNNTATFPSNRNMTAVELQSVIYSEVSQNSFTGQAIDVKQSCIA